MALWIGLIAVALAAVAVIAALRLRRRVVAFPEQLYEGRQQIRAGLRQVAGSQLRGASVDRRTRRQAAREISRAFGKPRRG